MPQTVFKCVACNVTLTVPLSELDARSLLSNTDGVDYLPRGFYVVCDDDYYSLAQGQYLVNLKDLVNTKPHRDKRRRNGCCGLDGCDGVNTLCGNGHEIGTERSDCWHAHAFAFERAAVRFDGRENS